MQHFFKIILFYVLKILHKIWKKTQLWFSCIVCFSRSSYDIPGHGSGTFEYHYLWENIVKTWEQLWLTYYQSGIPLRSTERAETEPRFYFYQRSGMEPKPLQPEAREQRYDSALSDNTRNKIIYSLPWVSLSHILILQSLEHVATRGRSGLGRNMHASTASLWPLNSCTSRCALRSHSWRQTANKLIYNVLWTEVIL